MTWQLITLSFKTALRRPLKLDMRKNSVNVIEKQIQNLTFISGWVLKRRNIASSADIVFPLPVGAPKRTLLSVWYRTWKACETPQRYHLTSITEKFYTTLWNNRQDADLCLNWIEVWKVVQGFIRRVTKWNYW